MKDLKEYLNKFKVESISMVGPLWNSPKSLPEPILFIDGGTKFSEGNGFSLGDNDSYRGKLDYTLPTEKDYSDFSFALDQIVNFKMIHLYGFLGGRKDHELINLGEVHHFLKTKERTLVNFEDKIFAYSQGSWHLNHNGIFSIFTFDDTKISLSGDCKYKLKESTITKASSHGLSNIGSGDIHINTSAPTFIFLISSSND